MKRIICLLFVWLPLLFPLLLKGQVWNSQSNAQVHLGEGVLFTINGDANNAGNFQNNGVLRLFGNWDNTGRYESLAGEIHLLSNGDQSLTHGGFPIYALILDGNGRKNLDQVQQIESELALLNGIAVVPQDQFLTLIQEAEIVEGGEDSYVDGRLRHLGTGYKFFPIIDNEGNYAPIELIDAQGSDLEITARAAMPNPNAVHDPSLNAISPNRYWQVEILAGTYEGSQVAVPMMADDILEEEEFLVLAEAEEMAGPFQSIGVSEVIGEAGDGLLISEDQHTMPFIAIGITNQFRLDGIVLVPNAFSPRAGEEVNRTLVIFGNSISTEGFRFRIMDRWGNLVFETEDVDEAKNVGWNGRIRNEGRETQMGVYTYHLRGQFENGESFDQGGSISLIR